MATIHPTAIVDSTVELGGDVAVGAYAIIEGKVAIAAGTVIGPHCIVRGHTIIGRNCKIGPAAYVGLDPQHLGYDGRESSLVIGDDTIIRETASLHRSMETGIQHATRVGDRCFLMGAIHIGHDSIIGNDVIIAHGALLGGHVEIGERTFMGGGSVVHQLGRVGRLAIVRGNEAVIKDVPPFGAAMYGALKGYNAVGCKRAGLSREAIRSIKAAYRCIHENRTVPNAVEAIRAIEPKTPEIQEILDFIANSKRGIRPSFKYFAQIAVSADE